ncbi:hypothetical protein [Microbacterium sp. NPDC077184]|uniref:protein kinase domain-containing protein n=1 Tax=Microbacterium sp. NPDC077184 TaxID=3154764 RepID=UPI003438547B
MDAVSSAAADLALLKEIERTATDSRLRHVELVASGRRFILGRALHPGSGEPALLTVSRRGDRTGLLQLRNIRSGIQGASSREVGVVLDRLWRDTEPDAPSRRGKAEWGCLVSTWHSDAISLEKAILGLGGARIKAVLPLIQSLVVQIRSLHNCGFAHGDISPSNVLVTPDGAPHLIDFEYLTGVDETGPGAAPQIAFADEAFETPGYSHPERMATMSTGSYSLADLKRWDMYALGRLILSTLADADPYDFIDLDTYHQRALRLIACLMLDGHNEPSDVALGLPVRFFQEEKFNSIEEVADALERVSNDAALESAVPELRWLPENVVEIGTMAPAAFTSRVRRLVNTTEMQQLGGFQQLGLISYIWPTATHTRIEHAIGTYSLACAAVSNLFADPQSPLFRVVIDPPSVRVLLATALLHDVGHYPLAHDLEEAYPIAFDHEKRSIDIVTSKSSPIRNLLADTTPDGWAVVPEDVGSVIAGKLLAGATISTYVCGLLHSIISGTLDVDKLDYLVRDSRALGVKAGEGIDVRRILASLTTVLVSEEKAPLRLGVRSKGVRPAELVGRIRSHMFGVVYWHHSYRAIKAMIHWIVWEAVAARGGGRKGGRAVEAGLYSELKPGKMFSTVNTSLDGIALPPREGAVMDYLVALSGASAAREINRVLGEKLWYRTILSIEHHSNETSQPFSRDREREIWEAADSLLGHGDSSATAQEGLVAKRIELTRAIQGRIVEWFRDRTEGETRTLVVGWESNLARFQVSAAKHQLFLLDLSETRKATDKNLYFAASERVGSRSLEPAEPIEVRRSYDQAQLSQEFIASNAVIRLFCHPDFAHFIVQAIPAEALYAIVHSEITNATGAPPR